MIRETANMAAQALPHLPPSLVPKGRGALPLNTGRTPHLLNTRSWWVLPSLETLPACSPRTPPLTQPELEVLQEITSKCHHETSCRTKWALTKHLTERKWIESSEGRG